MEWTSYDSEFLEDETTHTGDPHQETFLTGSQNFVLWDKDVQCAVESTLLDIESEMDDRKERSGPDSNLTSKHPFHLPPPPCLLDEFVYHRSTQFSTH